MHFELAVNELLSIGLLQLHCKVTMWFYCISSVAGAILYHLGFTFWSSLATTWHNWHKASMDSLWIWISLFPLWIPWMDHTPSSLGFDPQNFTQLPLQPSCIDLWMKVHVKGNIPLLLKVFVRLTSLCRTLYSVTEPCCSVLGYTRVCSMVYGWVKGPASATNNTAVMHNTFGICHGKNVSWVYFTNTW